MLRGGEWIYTPEVHLLQGEEGFKAERVTIGQTAVGTFRSLDAAIKRMTDPAPNQKAITDYQGAIARSEKEIGKEFKDQDKLEAAVRRKDQLRKELVGANIPDSPAALNLPPESWEYIAQMHGERLSRINTVDQGRRNVTVGLDNNGLPMAPVVGEPVVVATTEAPRATPKEPQTFTYWKRTRGGEYVGVEGAKPLVIKGFEKFDLFVVKSGSREWTVSDGTTGLSAATAPTKKGAISEITARLEGMGADGFADMIAKMVKSHGLSPRGQELQRPDDADPDADTSDELDDSLVVLSAGPVPGNAIANLLRKARAQLGEAALGRSVLNQRSETAAADVEALDPDVEEAMARADGVEKVSWWTRVKEAANDIFRQKYHFPHLDQVGDAPLIDILRNFQNTGGYSEMMAVNRMLDVVGKMGTKQRKLLGRILGLQDVLAEIDSGQRDPTLPLPFNLRNRQDVVDNLNHFQATRRTCPAC